MQTRRFTQQMHTILSLPVLKIPHIYCIRPQSITLIQSYGMTSEDMEHGLRCMKHFHAINNSAFELFTRKYRFGTAWGQVNGHMITLINVKCHWITPSEGSVGRLRVTRCIAVVVPCINHTHQSSHCVTFNYRSHHVQRHMFRLRHKQGNTLMF